MKQTILFTQRRFFNAKVLSHFGGCGTRRICSNKCSSDILAIPRFPPKADSGYPQCESVLWLKSSFVQKLSASFYLILAITVISGCATSAEHRAPSTEHRAAGVIDAVTKASPLWLHSEDDIPDSSIQVITAHQVRQKQLRQEDMLIVDVRSKDLFDERHIQGAVSLPLAELEQRYAELPKDREIILYCGGIDCPLSKTAAKRLFKLGFVNVKDMQEGISGWQKQGFPVVTDDHRLEDAR